MYNKVAVCAAVVWTHTYSYIYYNYNQGASKGQSIR